MKRKRAIVVAVVCAVLVGAAMLFAVFRGPKEPEYQGRKLSEWVRYLPTQWYANSAGSGVVERRRMAQEAVRAIGTNAVPFLLDWIRYEPNSWRFFIERACAAIHIRYAAVPTFGKRDRIVVAEGAAEAFEVLGTRAQFAAPRLKVIMRRYPETSARAAMALYYVGGSDLDWFAKAIHNP